MLKNFSEIRVESSVDKIIRQIRELITSGQLSPGDKLPPERKLSEVFGVGRTSVRDAIKKLEFYGILRTIPQSGTVVAGLGITALEGLITDVLKLEKSDFSSLVETRVIFETTALKAYELKVKNGESAVEEDLMFHLKISEASKNSVLNSLMLIITPDIVNSFVELKVCTDVRFLKTIEEHQQILQHIINQNESAASAAMRIHLNDVVEFSITNK